MKSSCQGTLSISRNLALVRNRRERKRHCKSPCSTYYVQCVNIFSRTDSAHLRQLSIQDTSPISPTTSTSSASAATQTTQISATTQQILIAHVLLALLATPPTYSVSLNKLKETLASKNGGVTAQAVTRPIYGCVAKRLLKIERGGGEQVVKFDV